MATYKVLQDIEAEDKLVGPLSLRQFIYAAIAVISLFIAFKLAFVSLFLIAPFVPVIVLFGTLALPFGHDQPSEVWLLAKIRFYIKPHLRIWNKDGNIDLVTITAPKAIAGPTLKNFTKTEAQSRLQALASTIDSRGWSIKNVNVNLNNAAPVPEVNDRLVDPSAAPQPVPQDDITAADDIMDAASNPVAQKLDKMMLDSAQQNHDKVVASLTDQVSKPKESAKTNDSAVTPDYWFMNDQQASKAAPAGYKRFGDDKIVNPHSEDTEAMEPETAEDDELLEAIETKKKRSDLVNSHLHTIEPLGHRHKKRVAKKAAAPQVTPPTNPGIINLALANKDNWTVATIARQAEKAKKKQSDDEVVISLH